MSDWSRGGGWGQGGRRRGWPLPGESFQQTFKVTIQGEYHVQPGGVIRSPERDDWDEGTGFWLGVDGDGQPKFGLGEAGANELTWDGSTLTIAGEGSGLTNIDGDNIQTGTIDADKLNVSELSAITADMGSLTAGSIVIGSTNKLWLNDADDGALNIGGATKASAPFRVTAAGALTATNAQITGTITASAGSITGTLSMGASGIIIAGTGTLDTDLTGIAFNDELITAQVSGVTQWVLDENGVVIRIDADAATNDLLFYNNAEAADAARLQLTYDGTGNTHDLDLLCYGYDFSTTTKVRIAAVGAGSDLADLFLTDGTIYTTTADVGIGTDTPLSPLHLGLATEDLELVDAGSASATEQDWIEVEVGGTTGYIRVYASK